MAFTTLSKSVGRVAALQKQNMSLGFSTYSLRGVDLRTDPFLNVDHFFMSEPTFPPHPHAGFSAVTYMFPDSQGSFLNTDSLGDKTVIKPGDLHWTQAGRGMMHEEIPTAPGIVCHGLQIFLNLSAANKLIEPKAMHVNAEDVPIYITAEGVRALVLAGECNGVHSPLKLAEPVTLLDVFLRPGATFEMKVPKEHNLFAMVIKGSVLFGPKGGKDEREQVGRQLDSNQVCDFKPDADAVCASGMGAEGAQFILFAGIPLNQASVWSGPFNGISQDQVDGFARSYQAGNMGHLVSSA